jgi:tetratricopeptide (TPR) repeat protein
MRLDDFIAQIKSRRVGRVAIGYAVAGWLAIQAAEIAFEAFEFPAAWMRLFIIAVAVGFPVAVVLSWMYDLTPGGIRRTEEAGAVEAPAIRPMFRLLVGLAIIVAIGLATVPLVRMAGDGPGIGDPRKSIIVFPFEVQALSGDLDYLEQASANLLGLAIGQWDDMRVFDDERTGSMLRQRSIQSPDEIDFALAQEMATEAGVGTFVLGDITTPAGVAADSLSIEAKVFDTASGERLTTETASSTVGGDPRAAFDELAAKVLQVSGAPPGDRPDLLSQTTQSLEAYREYVTGSRALQYLQIDSARAHLERAVAIDSTFALAYLRLAELGGWVGLEDAGQRRALVAKAVAYSADLPPRYRMLIDFHQAYGANRYYEAREIAERMIDRDSLDVEAWYQLGEAHFHDRPRAVPHSDSLGDIGLSLQAFQRALALDSAYVLAYLHIVDALGSCGAVAPWLCLPDDSTVYASNEELSERFGQATVDSTRAAARAARLATAEGWAKAAPTSERARSTLMNLLFDAERYAEVVDQVAVLDELGLRLPAALWRARVTHAQGDYGRAAAEMASAIAGDPLRLVPLFNTAADPEQIGGILHAGGRIGEGIDFVRRLTAVMPIDTVDAYNDRYHKGDLVTLLELEALASLGVRGELTGAMGHQWLDVLDAGYEPGTDAHGRRWAASGASILATYLTARDTTLLTRYIAGVDTTGTRSWETMAAHVALARGDVDEARERLAKRYPDYDSVEFSGRTGTVRLFSWSDLLAGLGDREEAAAAFALFDGDIGADWAPTFRVRSWLERGLIYEELGDDETARAMYERFIRAWGDGDEIVQPQVERARARLAGLGS